MREVIADILPPTEAKYGKKCEVKQVNALWGLSERMLQDIPDGSKWWQMYDDLELSVDRYSENSDGFAYVTRYSYWEEDFGYVTTVCMLRSDFGKKSLQKVVFREDPDLEALMLRLENSYDESEREAVDMQLEKLIVKQTNELLADKKSDKNTASYLDALQLTELLEVAIREEHEG